jgi:hypothetical protein
MTFEATNKFEEAMGWYEKSLEADPNQTEPY